uniref:Pyrin domain-containing protein n=1 Tax=Sinocyclocheilus rhinocerous TaxID=307959 RepID=A0A673JAV1_9TELE
WHALSDEILLQHLEYLTSDELKLFKWHLTEGVEAFKKIPEGKLEKAERCTIVTCMTDQYEVDGAAKLTVMILKKMQKNNDAKQLQEKLDMKGKDEFSIHKLFLKPLFKSTYCF